MTRPRKLQISEKHPKRWARYNKTKIKKAGKPRLSSPMAVYDVQPKAETGTRRSPDAPP
ncbi:MAG: hypothetical protein LBV17_06415 [Treponema sp.]|nr:hypothetical protein [Treponema sp.]